MLKADVMLSSVRKGRLFEGNYCSIQKTHHLKIGVVTHLRQGGYGGQARDAERGKPSRSSRPGRVPFAWHKILRFFINYL